jgi:hypothetical protein
MAAVSLSLRSAWDILSLFSQPAAADHIYSEFLRFVIEENNNEALPDFARADFCDH